MASQQPGVERPDLLIRIRRIRKRWKILAAIVLVCLLLSRCDAVQGLI
jgi:hypothetical protein